MRSAFFAEMANPALTYTIPENYRMLKELGQGCYGHVIKCLKRDTKETVAVKILKQRHSKHRNIEEVSYFLKITIQRYIFTADICLSHYKYALWHKLLMTLSNFHLSPASHNGNAQMFGP